MISNNKCLHSLQACLTGGQAARIPSSYECNPTYFWTTIWKHRYSYVVLQLIQNKVRNCLSRLQSPTWQAVACLYSTFPLSLHASYIFILLMYVSSTVPVGLSACLYSLPRWRLLTPQVSLNLNSNFTDKFSWKEILSKEVLFTQRNFGGMIDIVTILIMVIVPWIHI